MAIIINQTEVQDEKIMYQSSLTTYELKNRTATTIKSIVGTRNTSLYTFKVNIDYSLDSKTNRVTWLTNGAKPDNLTYFFVDYVYEPVPTDIPFTTEQYGRDIKLIFANEGLTGDFTNSARGDLLSVTLNNNLLQALRMKLMLIKGYNKIYPELGSELFNLVGETMTNENLELMKLYIIEALNQDPRVEDIQEVNVTPDRLLGKVTVNVVVTPIGSHEPLNLVYDFFLEDVTKNYL